jgi:hypothetical protein
MLDFVIADLGASTGAMDGKRPKLRPVQGLAEVALALRIRPPFRRTPGSGSTGKPSAAARGASRRTCGVTTGDAGLRDHVAGRQGCERIAVEPDIQALPRILHESAEAGLLHAEGRKLTALDAHRLDAAARARRS